MRSCSIVVTYPEKYWPSPAKNCLESIEARWPKHYKKFVYPDNMENQTPLTNGVYLDLYDEQPGWAEFRRRNLRKRTPVMTEGDPAYNYEFDVIKFSAKVFAMIDAAKKCDTDMLYYLDSDTFTFEDVPEDWVEHIMPEDCFITILGRLSKFTETGFLSFNLRNPYAEEFFEEWSKWYIEDKYWQLDGTLPVDGYTDCHTLDGTRKMFINKYKDYKENDLNDGRWAGFRGGKHPFINSELGQYMDHMKGAKRKELGKSLSDDVKYKWDHPYWKDIKNG